MDAGGEGEREALARPRGVAARRTEEMRIRLASGACGGAARAAGLVVAVSGLLEKAVAAFLDALRLAGSLSSVAAGSLLAARALDRSRRLEGVVTGGVGGCLLAHVRTAPDGYGRGRRGCAPELAPDALLQTCRRRPFVRTRARHPGDVLVDGQPFD